MLENTDMPEINHTIFATALLYACCGVGIVCGAGLSFLAAKRSKNGLPFLASGMISVISGLMIWINSGYTGMPAVGLFTYAVTAIYLLVTLGLITRMGEGFLKKIFIILTIAALCWYPLSLTNSSFFGPNSARLNVTVCLAVTIALLGFVCFTVTKESPMPGKIKIFQICLFALVHTIVGLIDVYKINKSVDMEKGMLHVKLFVTILTPASAALVFMEFTSQDSEGDTLV